MRSCCHVSGRPSDCLGEHWAGAPRPDPAERVCAWSVRLERGRSRRRPLALDRCGWIVWVTVPSGSVPPIGRSPSPLAGTALSAETLAKQPHAPGPVRSAIVADSPAGISQLSSLRSVWSLAGDSRGQYFAELGDRPDDACRHAYLLLGVLALEGTVMRTGGDHTP